MADINELIATLRATIEEKFPELELFDNGLSDDDLAELAEALPVPLPDSLRALFRAQWRGPSIELPSPASMCTWFFDDVWLGELETMAELEADFAEMDAENEDTPTGPMQAKWWRPEWIPFMTTGGGDFLCLDFAPLEGGTPGQVISFFHDTVGDRGVLAPSLEAFLEGILERLQTGQYVREREFLSLTAGTREQGVLNNKWLAERDYASMEHQNRAWIDQGRCPLAVYMNYLHALMQTRQVDKLDEALSVVAAARRKWPSVFTSMIDYSFACGYAFLGNKPLVLQHAKAAVDGGVDADDLLADDDLKAYWTDPDFLAAVGRA